MSQLSHAQFPLRRHPDLLVDHRRARSAAVAEPRGANAESRDRLRWPASFRNGGRHQIGTAADIKSESPAGLRRNSHEGIFVAHSVNFDYGFIAYEYERLGLRFRFPKLCTCAGMRRRYPGHKSYSLGNLCETYNIDLEDHHRALCDARATAQLLNLINQQRDARPETSGIAA